jgi:hypothetical protein
MIFGLVSLMTLVSISLAVSAASQSIMKIEASVSLWDVQFSNSLPQPYSDPSSRSFKTK